MSTRITREICEFGGVPYYFSSNLLMNILQNEKSLVENATDAKKSLNPVAAYITGLSDEKPTPSQISQMIHCDEQDDDVRIHSAMDAFFVLNYEKDFCRLGAILAGKGGHHDIYEILMKRDNQFDKHFSQLVLQSAIKKTDGSGILGFLNRFYHSKTIDEKFEAIMDLCRRDLDWDAYVLIKLCELETPENRAAVEAIRENTLIRLTPKFPGLVDIIRNGPKLDPETEFARLMEQPIAVVAKNAAISIYERIVADFSQDTMEILELRADEFAKLYYLIDRALLQKSPELLQAIYESIPENIRAVMLSGLEKDVFKNSLIVAYDIVQVFLELQEEAPKQNLNYRMEVWAQVGVYRDFENVWRRNAMTNVLRSLRLSISRVSDDISLLPEMNRVVPDSQIRSTLKLALEFAINLIEKFGVEHQMLMLPTSKMLDEKTCNCLKAILTENSNVPFVKDHKSRIIKALSSPESTEPDNVIVTPSGMKIHLIDSKYNGVYERELVASVLRDNAMKKAVVDEIKATDQKVLLVDELKEEADDMKEEMDDPKDETNSIGDGVVVSAVFQNSSGEHCVKQAPKLASLKIEAQDDGSCDTLSADGWESPKKTIHDTTVKTREISPTPSLKSEDVVKTDESDLGAGDGPVASKTQSQTSDLPPPSTKFNSSGFGGAAKFGSFGASAGGGFGSGQGRGTSVGGGFRSGGYGNDGGNRGFAPRGRGSGGGNGGAPRGGYAGGGFNNRY
ncbi:unnamed protein product [Caenorhabditis bovis]|uniref:Uncharacterized protein n=1 Tax=Caenorhabditis bovis TaxID=2654633 RepID=A0A8S1F4R0_9PELO|nr:unnamed protein product [Caenorhabditis bovis]